MPSCVIGARRSGHREPKGPESELECVDHQVPTLAIDLAGHHSPLRHGREKVKPPKKLVHRDIRYVPSALKLSIRKKERSLQNARGTLSVHVLRRWRAHPHARRGT